MALQDMDLDLDATQVSVAVTGAVSYGKVSSLINLPNPASAPLPAGVKQLGYLSEDGIVLTKEADDTDIFAWQNTTKVRVIRSNGSLSIVFSCIQNTKDVRELWWGATEVAGKLKIRPEAKLTTGVIIDVFDNSDDEGAMHHTRYIFERGQISGTGDLTYISTDAVKYEFTMTALADSNGDAGIIDTVIVPAVIGG